MSEYKTYKLAPGHTGPALDGALGNAIAGYPGTFIFIGEGDTFPLSGIVEGDVFKLNGVFYVWLSNVWQLINGGGDMSPEEIKTRYESNPDTNVYTDAEKLKLAGLKPVEADTITLKEPVATEADLPTEDVEYGDMREVLDTGIFYIYYETNAGEPDEWLPTGGLTNLEDYYTKGQVDSIVDVWTRMLSTETTQRQTVDAELKSNQDAMLQNLINEANIRASADTTLRQSIEDIKEQSSFPLWSDIIHEDSQPMIFAESAEDGWENTPEEFTWLAPQDCYVSVAAEYTISLNETSGAYMRLYLGINGKELSSNCVLYRPGSVVAKARYAFEPVLLRAGDSVSLRAGVDGISAVAMPEWFLKAYNVMYAGGGGEQFVENDPKFAEWRQNGYAQDQTTLANAIQAQTTAIATIGDTKADKFPKPTQVAFKSFYDIVLGEDLSGVTIRFPEHPDSVVPTRDNYSSILYVRFDNKISIWVGRGNTGAQYPVCYLEQAIDSTFPVRYDIYDWETGRQAAYVTLPENSIVAFIEQERIDTYAPGNWPRDTLLYRDGGSTTYNLQSVDNDLLAHIQDDSARWLTTTKAMSDLSVELKKYVQDKVDGTIVGFEYDYSQTQTVISAGGLVNLGNVGEFVVPAPGGGIQARVGGLLGAALSVLRNGRNEWTSPLNLLLPVQSPEIQVNQGDVVTAVGIVGLGQSIEVVYFPRKPVV